MKIVRRRLDIDRWMSLIRCICGREFWHCERRPVVCPAHRNPGCSGKMSVEDLKVLVQKFVSGGQ